MRVKLTISLVFFSLFLRIQGQEIIYTSQKNNNDNLCIINEEGKIIELTNNARKDSSPMVSPDGEHIVFTSERIGWWKIWTLDVEKNVFKQLTNSNSAEYSPSWSPDGKYIVFVSSRDGNQEIYTMTKNGSHLKNISNNSGSDIMPFWAKDNRIYFSSIVNHIYQIVSCLPDGSDKRILTHSKDNKLMPQVSNDLSEVLYYGDKDGNFEIYKMNIATQKVKRLTNSHLMDIRPRWSSDNSKIVFERGNKGNHHHIYVMDNDGNNLKQITFSNYNYTPSFVPLTKSFIKN